MSHDPTVVLIIKAPNMELNFKWCYKNVGSGEGKESFKKIMSVLRKALLLKYMKVEVSVLVYQLNYIQILGQFTLIPLVPSW